MFTSDDDTLRFFVGYRWNPCVGGDATDIWVDVFSGLEQ